MEIIYSHKITLNNWTLNIYVMFVAAARVLHARNKNESFDGLKEEITSVASDNFMYDSRGSAFIYADDYRGNLRIN